MSGGRKEKLNAGNLASRWDTKWTRLVISISMHGSDFKVIVPLRSQADS